MNFFMKSIPLKVAIISLISAVVAMVLAEITTFDMLNTAAKVCAIICGGAIEAFIYQYGSAKWFKNSTNFAISVQVVIMSFLTALMLILLSVITEFDILTLLAKVCAVICGVAIIVAVSLKLFGNNSTNNNNNFNP